MSLTAELTITVGDLDKLADLVLEIDESKGKPAIQQVYINLAHQKIESLLGKYSQIVYPDEEIAA